VRLVALLLATATLLGVVALAAFATSPVQADALDQEVREIASTLRCPVCENISTADSQSELASQMRQVIREQLQQGKSRQDIVDYFLERYGESVLFEPPKRGFSLVAWLVAPLGVLAGAVVVWRIIHRRAPAGSPDGSASAWTPALSLPPATSGEDDVYRARLRAELAEGEPAFAGERTRRPAASRETSA
jgi:cytochrome c-type biogenesis protein CcmH